MFIEPMLLEKRDQPFTHADYIFEPKIDGHRLILSHVGGVTRLYTRHNNDVTRQYPEITSVNFGYDVILDGEIACIDPLTGAICFESVMERFQTRKDDKIRSMRASLPVNFIVFDVLFLNGNDLRGRPLMKRKETLAGLQLDQYGCFGTIPYFERDGESLFTQICANKMEGIVAKRKESAYVGRRSDAWLKIINWTYADVVITGYRKEEFGWLTAVQTDDGKLRYAGVIELGVTPTQKKAFYGVSKALISGEDRNNVYVEPRIRAKVKIRNWTKKGLLRSPAFVEFIL